MRTLDLFCGGGGSSWGAQAAGAQVVGGVDAWNVATATYAANFPAAQAFTCTLTDSTDPATFDSVGPIDLLLASPECTNHTWARGNRTPDEGSRRTARYITSFAHHFRPRWMVLENVTNMRKWAGHGPLVDEIAALGYGIREQVIDAVDAGVPQTRRRLFVLCERGRRPDAVPILPVMRQAPVSEIIDWSDAYRSRLLFAPTRATATIERARRGIEALGRGVPFLIVYYGSDGAGGWQPLSRPLRTLTTLDRFGLVTWQGGTAMLRMLQPPELVRAMGFDRVGSPDGYRLPVGTRRDRIKLLGNGVCPPVMQTIVSHLCRSRELASAAE